MKIVLTIILGLYMAVNLLAILGNAELRKSKIKTGAYILAGLFLIAACVMAWKNSLSGVIFCIAGLVIYAVCAVHNGICPAWKTKLETSYDQMGRKFGDYSAIYSNSEVLNQK